MNYKKIKQGDFAYYVNTKVMESLYANDEFAFCSNSHVRRMTVSDFVVHIPTQKLEKCRFLGEDMFDALLGIGNSDIVSILGFNESLE